MAIDKITASGLGDGGVSTADIADDAVTLDKLSASGTKDATTFLRGDDSFQVVAVTPTAVSDQANTSTGQFALPSGTTAQRPGTSYTGAQRYNTDLGVMEYYNGSAWTKVSAQLSVLSSVTGRIYAGVASTLTLAGTGFLSSNLIVNFVQASDSIDINVTVTPSSDTAATVTIPSTVYSNVTAGRVVGIRVTNSDASQSAVQNVTALALPSGGTISTTGNYRVHKFTSSGNFVVPANTSFSARESLVIGAGGGGGAGGLIHTTSETFSAGNTYAVTIGSGGSANTAGSDGDSGPFATNGNNSVFNGRTANGGGAGGSGGGANASAGGSGGGGSGEAANATGGAGTSGQGNRGGDVSNTGGGGGGGAGAAGQDGDVRGTDLGGYGGAGLQKNITGSNLWYAAGGNGSNNNGVYETQPSTNGIGGISNTGGSSGASAGAVNTGAGGGATTHTTNTHGTGNGGSGVVIIRYILN